MTSFKPSFVPKFAVAASLAAACNPGSKSDSKAQSQTRETVPIASPIGKPDPSKGVADSSQWPQVLKNKAANNKMYGELICDRGLEITKQAGKDDFSEVFRSVCADGSPTQGFIDLIDRAYEGQGSGEVTLLEDPKISEVLVTKFLFGYSIKADLDGPANFAALPIYEEFAKGIVDTQGNSRLEIKKEKERVFPGKGSVREITLSYSLPIAKGAALYDIRRTESNNYLLVEGSQDVNMTTEHLLDGDKNPFYHASRSMVFGMKAGGGKTYLVYFTELVVKNRIDPKRLEDTIKKVMALCQETVFNTAAKAAGKK